MLFYAGESAANPGFHCVGVATSTNVEGPYAPQAEPLVCPISYAPTPVSGFNT